MRKEGFEPPRPFGHKILSLARLPVPPLPQWFFYITVCGGGMPLRFRSNSSLAKKGWLNRPFDSFDIYT